MPENNDTYKALTATDVGKMIHLLAQHNSSDAILAQVKEEMAGYTKPQLIALELAASRLGVLARFVHRNRPTISKGKA